MSKLVFSNGVFDLLHPGHFNLLLQCRQLAGKNGRVVIGLDSDEKVSFDKGLERPILSFDYRKQALLDLETCWPGVSLIDEVFAFSSNKELYSIIQSLNPDYLVKGLDWKDRVIGSDIAEIRYCPLNPRYSTTNLLDQVRLKL